MKRIYLFLGWGIVILGAIHMLATMRFFKSVTGAALWFFSGGMAMSLTGALNLLNRSYGQIAPGLRKVCIGANIIMTAFGILAGAVNRASIAEFVLVLGLCGGATALSLTRGALIVRDGMLGTQSSVK